MQIKKTPMAFLAALCAATPLPTFAQQAPLPTSSELRDKAFEAAQLAMIGDAAAALTRVAAGFARGNSPVADLERKREELTQQRDATEQRYLELSRQDAVKASGELQKLSATETQLAALGEQIEIADPAYAELTRPRALSVQQVRELLNDDEALILLLANDDATYTFAVTREGIAWSRAAELPSAALRGKVAALREQLAVDRSRGLEREGAGISGFDRAAAHDLYRQLLQPLESSLVGKTTLLTVTEGPLASLPLQLLVTVAPKGTGNDITALRETKWLADTYAVASLPGVSSLYALRCLLVTRSDRHRGCRGQGSMARAPRTPPQIVFTGFGAPALNGAPTDARNAPPNIESMFNGDYADPARLRTLSSLPGSKTELEALAAQFGPQRAILSLGPEATESAVKASLPMQTARYVVFATHGLLGAETGVVGEPGLVFTPPADGSAGPADDGLLTASEAARLNLSADLVVLSACNTAAGGGGDTAEGLSGLARAFLFAGARSLLVSHWPVDDAATSTLMINTFKAIESGSASRLAAFQQAVRTLRNDPRYASPAYWAPFTLVGAP